MKLDLQDISSEYGQHFDWDDAENHEVEMAMANVKPWEEKMMKLRKELSIMSEYHYERVLLDRYSLWETWTGTRFGWKPLSGTCSAAVSD